MLILTPAALPAESRTLSMPSYLANPGGLLDVPLNLENAAGLAAIRVRINFDPSVLELQSVTSGPLGHSFVRSQGNGPGFVQLVFVRAQSLESGDGRLAVLRFQANPGAVADLYSELAIADVGLSDSTGLVDLRQKDSLALTHGQVAVTVQPNIDNAGSGLPDWWEREFGLDLFTLNPNLDPERDGFPNLLEYAFGANPNLSDLLERGVQPGRAEHHGETFLSIGFFRRLGDPLLDFRVQETPVLGSWSDLDLEQQMIGPPQAMGDGTEWVTVRGTIPITGENALPRGFLRVKVATPTP